MSDLHSCSSSMIARKKARVRCELCDEGTGVPTLIDDGRTVFRCIQCVTGLQDNFEKCNMFAQPGSVSCMNADRVASTASEDLDVTRCDWCNRDSVDYVLYQLCYKVCGFCYHSRRDRRGVMVAAIESIFCFRQHAPCRIVRVLKLVVARVASYLWASIYPCTFPNQSYPCELESRLVPLVFTNYFMLYSLICVQLFSRSSIRP